MNMNKKTWEEFWEWICDESINVDTEFIDEWLSRREDEWQALQKCPVCGKRGIATQEEHKHSYLIKRRDFCPNCNKYYNEEDLWEEAKTQAKCDIESDRLSPNQVIGLVDAFKFVAGEFKRPWVVALIIEKNEEKYELLERMNRKIENDKNKEK